MTLWEFLRVLNRWKVVILLVVCISVSTAVFKAFTSPPLYAAQLTALLPEGSANPMIGGPLSQLMNISAGGGSRMPIVVALLKSRRMAKDIVDHFQLQKRYPGASVTSLERHVAKNIEVGETLSGFLLEVRLDDPRLAADIANFSISNLDRINEELDITSSKPMVLILDPAVPPLSPVSRKTLTKALVALLLSLSGSCFSVFLIEYFRKLRAKGGHPQKEAKLDERLKEELLFK